MNPNAAGQPGMNQHGDPNMMGLMGGPPGGGPPGSAGPHHQQMGGPGGGGGGGAMHGPPPGSGQGPGPHGPGGPAHPGNHPMGGGHPGGGQQHGGGHQGGMGRQQMGGAGRCCAGCGAKIIDRYLLEALDRYWHNGCLKCSCCHVTLADIGSSCFTKGGMILCKNDYIRIFGTSGACSACGQMIPASEFVMRAQANVYHLKCFACVKCHHQLVAGDRYNLVNGNVLCEQDCLKILKGGPGGPGGPGGVGAGGPGSLHGGPGPNAGTGVRKNAKMRVNNAIKV